jgi:hypothetical protein
MDCTGRTPVKTTVQLPHNQWITMQKEISDLYAKHLSAYNTFTAQVTILQHYHLIAPTANPNSVTSHFQQTAAQHPRLFHSLPIINDSNINAMCAIFFTLKNGTTAVLGLNSFVNLIGFDIISFHHGNATGGIQTSGLVNKQTPPGPYVGVMFGFLGYWYGDRTGVGTYGNLTAAGFTIITAWVPIP